MKYRFINGFIIFFLLSFSVVAQEEIKNNEEALIEGYDREETDERVYLLGFDLNALQSIGQFYPEKDLFLFGVNINFQTQLVKEKGLMIGVDLSFNSLEEAKGSYIEYDGVFQRDIDFTTSTKITMMMINTRYYLDVFWGRFNPYVEALMGGKILSTYSDFIDINDDTYSDSNWHKFSFSPSFGLGSGIQYQLGDNTYIDIKIRYLSGSADTYYILRKDRNSADIDIDNFKLSISKTDVAYYSVGLVVKI